ncbi:hypothetical protein R1sor_006202 [Riccia sorocarpa]|uniref:Uncharacterized protein n=1 Tax=Riccia sorocarpa TaxID=122646 RepID=A0ABD3HNQ1_9MARC
MELSTAHGRIGIRNSGIESSCTSAYRNSAGSELTTGLGFRLSVRVIPLGNSRLRIWNCSRTLEINEGKVGIRAETWSGRSCVPLQNPIRGSKVSIKRFRVRALDDESDPLGPGYWDRAEGKNQMAEIEDMKELVAEAERLKNSQGETETQEQREERARQDGAKMREQLAQVMGQLPEFEMKRAREQAEKRKTAEKMYQLGQTAYARGMYDKSVELFENALINVQSSTNLGGEIQIWLAMAYDANNRHGDCIALYKRLEARHPNRQIRRQAADLRYILEAPKLKISREEMVSIPIIERDYDKTQKTYSQKLRDRRRPKPKMPKEKDYLEDWMVFELPPRWERNPYVWVALTVWLTLCGIALMFQD